MAECVITKSDVKVYTKPEYHPLLRNTDISDPDFKRKEKEKFGIGKASVLSKICSENSEDAQTWYYFSRFKKDSANKEKWLEKFLEDSIGPSKEIPKNLSKAEFLFWRGIEEEPFYPPPSTLPYKEGNTEVDLTIKIPDEAIIFVEAKYDSPISMSTKYGPDRDQIIRNIDVGTLYASRECLRFYFILLTKQEDIESKKLLEHYRENPDIIFTKLSHRTDLKRTDFGDTLYMGYNTWENLP